MTRLRLVIEVDVDDVGHTEYLKGYPGLGRETAAQTLFREAVCQWDFEGLIGSGTESLEGAKLADAIDVEVELAKRPWWRRGWGASR